MLDEQGWEAGYKQAHKFPGYIQVQLTHPGYTKQTEKLDDLTGCLAPAIAAIPQPISTLALLWLGLAIASLLLGFPMPTGDFVIPASSTRIAEPSWLASALGTLLATTAGLLFSCGSASRRLLTNAHRNPRRHPQ